MSKSNLVFILFLVIGYIFWKWLDYLQLPNSFNILLIVVTLICGVLWLYQRFYLSPKRSKLIAHSEQLEGRTLTDEEKEAIAPILKPMHILLHSFLSSLLS